MKKNNTIILPASLCSVRIMDIPPVSNREIEQIIRYRLSSYYPGSVDDLAVDYIREGEKVLIFYCLKERIESLRSDKQRIRFYGTYHLLYSIKNKNGHYAVILESRIEVHRYSDNHLQEQRTLEDTPVNRSELLSDGIQLFQSDKLELSKIQPLFQIRKKRNYLMINLFFTTLLIGLLQFAYYRQITLDEKYRTELKQSILLLSEKNALITSSEEEMRVLLTEYKRLLSEKPLNIYSFLSDLSSALGSDVKIDSLILKNMSFQLNGKGMNPLEKMENFQNNPSFHSVIPYQVKNLEGTRKESFSLTGMYGDE